MRKSVGYLSCALLLVVACSAPTPLDKMQPGEKGRVVYINDGDSLVLNTGQSVRLVGIEAPAKNAREDDPEPFARESARILEDLVMGRTVRLHYAGMTRDRYGRALAHVTTEDGTGPYYWINLEMVRRGAARVRLYPDTSGGGEKLLAAEQAARETGDGLWGRRAYQAMNAASLDQDTRGYMLVRGKFEASAALPETGDRPRRTLCSRTLEAASLIVDIEFTARALCETGFGQLVEIRGWVSDGRMELVHPLHLKQLSETD